MLNGKSKNAWFATLKNEAKRIHNEEYHGLKWTSNQDEAYSINRSQDKIV